MNSFYLFSSDHSTATFRELSSVVEVLKHSPSFADSTQRRVHVFLGSEEGVQVGPFVTAWSRLRLMSSSAILVTLTVKELKSLQWSPTELVEWLLRSHVHFILTHVHQGMLGMTEDWSILNIYRQLIRLYAHPGFPSGDCLMCPIFTQDKFGYIRCVPKVFLNTLVVRLDDSSTIDTTTNYSLLRAKLLDFMSCIHLEGAGFVVKAPFTTNCEFRRYCADLEAVVGAIRLAAKIYHKTIPYVMVQGRVRNNNEKRIVCFNGEPLYIARVNSKNSMQVSRQELFCFARAAIHALKAHCSYAILDGLVRVDIFKTSSGGLVVNEFESLEAACYQTDGHIGELKLTAKLESYWSKKIKDYVLM